MQGTMGKTEAGMYLRERREARGLSVRAVARHLQTSKSQVDRIEAGEIDTRSSLLIRYARLVGANMERLAALFVGESYDEDSEWSEWDDLSPEQRRKALEFIRSIVRGE